MHALLRTDSLALRPRIRVLTAGAALLLLLAGCSAGSPETAGPATRPSAGSMIGTPTPDTPTTPEASPASTGVTLPNEEGPSEAPTGDGGAATSSGGLPESVDEVCRLFPIAEVRTWLNYKVFTHPTAGSEPNCGFNVDYYNSPLDSPKLEVRIKTGSFDGIWVALAASGTMQHMTKKPVTVQGSPDAFGGCAALADSSQIPICFVYASVGSQYVEATVINLKPADSLTVAIRAAERVLGHG